MISSFSLLLSSSLFFLLPSFAVAPAVRLSKHPQLGPYTNPAHPTDLHPYDLNMGEIAAEGPGFPFNGNALLSQASSMSSFISEYPPSLCNDGITATFCASTLNDTNPWLVLNSTLPALFELDMYPRTDCCWGRTSGMSVDLLDAYPNGTITFGATLLNVTMKAMLSLLVPTYTLRLTLPPAPLGTLLVCGEAVAQSSSTSAPANIALGGKCRSTSWAVPSSQPSLVASPTGCGACVDGSAATAAVTHPADPSPTMVLGLGGGAWPPLSVALTNVTAGALVELVHAPTGRRLYTSAPLPPPATPLQPVLLALPQPYLLRLSKLSSLGPYTNPLGGGDTTPYLLNLADVAAADAVTPNALLNAPTALSSTFEAQFGAEACSDSVNTTHCASAPGDSDPVLWLWPFGGKPLVSVTLTPRSGGTCPNCPGRLTRLVVELLNPVPGTPLAPRVVGVTWGLQLGTTVSPAPILLPLPLYTLRLSKLAVNGPYGPPSDSHVLNIADVAVYSLGSNPGGENRVLGAGCSASSVYSTTYACGAALDGSGATAFYSAFSGDTSPWLLASIAGSSPIGSIVVTPRQDCCGWRTSGVLVELMLASTGLVVYNVTLPPVYTDISSPPLTLPLPLPCPLGSYNTSSSSSSSSSSPSSSPQCLPCPAGFYGASPYLTTRACNGPCTAAAPGFVCREGSPSPTGEPCPPHYFCPGGAALPVLCNCPGLCAAGGLSSEPIGLASAWSVRTLAGNGSGHAAVGNGGSGGSSSLWSPMGLAPTGAGGLLVCEFKGHRVRGVALDTGATVSLVGSPSGVGGFAEGTGTAALLKGPLAIAFVPTLSPMAYLAESGNCIVRAVHTGTWAVSVVAGSPGQCTTSVDGTGTAATFRPLNGLALHPAGGALYVVGWGENRVRVVTLGSRAVSTLSGMTGVAGYQDGSTPLFSGPIGVLAALDARTGATVVHIGDFANNRLRAVYANGSAATLAGNGAAGCVDGAALGAQLFSPCHLASDPSGYGAHVFFADQGNHRIRRFTRASGTVTTLAGQPSAGARDGVGAGAAFSAPYGIALNETSGEVYVGDNDSNRVRLLTCAVCPPGHFCPGPPPSFQHPCPAGSACALGSSAPSPCPPGYSSGPRAASCTACQQGYYCMGGGALAQPCPPGTFGGAVLLTNSSCSGPCTGVSAGYGCGPGSTAPQGTLCPPFFFCPGGSTPPQQCSCPGACNTSGLVSEPAGQAVLWTTETLVGSGVAASTDGVGSSAGVWGPAGMVLDGSGGVLLAEFYGHRIRWVSPPSTSTTTPGVGGVTITTLAGTGAPGFSDATGTEAAFNGPLALTAVSSSGIVYIADNFNRRVRSLTLDTLAVGTLAGSGANACVDGVGTGASFLNPNGVAVDASGLFVYVVGWGENRLRRVRVATQQVSTLAGTGALGFGDGPGASALFSGSIGVTVLEGSSGSSSSILVADFTNNRIRSVAADTWVVRTVAGSGAAGFADGLGTAAVLRSPCLLHSDASGQYVWFADQANNRVRRLSVGGTWRVVTLGGGGGSLMAGDGAPFNAPYGIAANASSGVVYVGDQNAHRVRALTCNVCPGGYFCPGSQNALLCPASSYCPPGSASPIPCAPGTSSPPGSPTASACEPCPLGWWCPGGGALSQPCPSGVYGAVTGLSTPTCSGPCNAAVGWGCGAGSVSPTGLPCAPGFFCGGGALGPQQCACPGLCRGTGLAAEPTGAATIWSTVTVAGSGVPGFAESSSGGSAGFNKPSGLTLNPTGQLLYVADFVNNRVRQVNLSHASYSVTTVVGSGIAGYADSPLPLTARLNGPLCLASDHTGGLFIGDNFNFRIRQAWPGAGRKGGVVTLAGNGVSASVDATGTAASFASLHGLALDPQGLSLFIVGWSDNRVRVLTLASGMVSTLAGSAMGGAANGVGAAAQLFRVVGIGYSAGGGGWNGSTPSLGGPSLIVGDWGNNRVRLLALATASVSTLAGSGAAAWADGPAASSTFFNPNHVAVDARGSVYIADEKNSRVRSLAMATGAVTTLAGSASPGISNGLGAQARFTYPFGMLWAPGSGTVYVGDSGSALVRALTCSACPAGMFCVGTLASLCPGYSYCPEGSSAPTACPPGTGSALTGLGSLGACFSPSLTASASAGATTTATPPPTVPPSLPPTLTPSGPAAPTASGIPVATASSSHPAAAPPSLSPSNSSLGLALQTTTLAPSTSTSTSTTSTTSALFTPTPPPTTTASSFSTDTTSATLTGTSTPTPTSTLSPGASGSNTASTSWSSSATPSQPLVPTPTPSSSPSLSPSGTSTLSPSSSPTPTASMHFIPSAVGASSINSSSSSSSSITTTATPSATPSASASSTFGSPSASPTPSLEAGTPLPNTGPLQCTSATPSRTPTGTPTLPVLASSTVSASPTASPTLSASSTASLSGTTSHTPSSTGSPTPSLSSSSGSPLGSATTPSNSLTASPTQTPTASVTRGASASTSSTSTLSASSSFSGTPTPSLTVGASSSSTSTTTLSGSPTQTPTPSMSVGLLPSTTSSSTLSASPTSSPTPSLTNGASSSTSSTPSLTSSPTSTTTPSLTAGVSPLSTPTPSLTSSPTQTPTASLSKGSSPSTTSSSTSTGSPTITPTPSLSRGTSPSTSFSATLSASPTGTPSSTLSMGATSSTSSTASLTSSSTPTPTATLSSGASSSTSSTQTLSSSPTGTPSPTLSTGASPSTTTSLRITITPTVSPPTPLSLGASSPSTTPSHAGGGGSGMNITNTGTSTLSSTPGGGLGSGVAEGVAAAAAASGGVLKGSGLSLFFMGTGGTIGLALFAGGVWMVVRKQQRRGGGQGSLPHSSAFSKGRGGRGQGGKLGKASGFKSVLKRSAAEGGQQGTAHPRGLVDNPLRVSGKHK